MFRRIVEVSSLENVAQAGRGCGAPAKGEMRKQRNLGPLALRSPPIFIVSRASQRDMKASSENVGQDGILGYLHKS